MKNHLDEAVASRQPFTRRSYQLSKIMERMYAQKIDSTFSALGKAIGDDYNVSDRALGNQFVPMILFNPLFHPCSSPAHKYTLEFSFFRCS